MFSLCYLPTAGRLTITIIKARNLKAMDITGASGMNEFKAQCGFLSHFPPKTQNSTLSNPRMIFERRVIVWALELLEYRSLWELKNIFWFAQFKISCSLKKTARLLFPMSLWFGVERGGQNAFPTLGICLCSRLLVTAMTQRQTVPLWQSPRTTEPILLLLAYGQSSDHPRILSATLSKFDNKNCKLT